MKTHISTIQLQKTIPRPQSRELGLDVALDSYARPVLFNDAVLIA